MKSDLEPGDAPVGTVRTSPKGVVAVLAVPESPIGQRWLLSVPNEHSYWAGDDEVADWVEVYRPEPTYPNGTIARAYDDANMAIKTPEGWRIIDNIDFVTEGDTTPSHVLSGWQVVYNPSSVKHQDDVHGGAEFETLP